MPAASSPGNARNAINGRQRQTILFAKAVGAPFVLPVSQKSPLSRCTPSPPRAAGNVSLKNIQMPTASSSGNASRGTSGRRHPSMLNRELGARHVTLPAARKAPFSRCTTSPPCAAGNASRQNILKTQAISSGSANRGINGRPCPAPLHLAAGVPSVHAKQGTAQAPLLSFNHFQKRKPPVLFYAQGGFQFLRLSNPELYECCLHKHHLGTWRGRCQPSSTSRRIWHLKFRRDLMSQHQYP